VMIVCVSVCVCLFAIISSELHGRSSPNVLCMLPMAVARSFCRRSDRLCTSGFMNDVIFAHKPRLLDVAAPAEVQCARSLEPGYKLCAVIPAADQRTHGITFRALKVTSQVAKQGE